MPGAHRSWSRLTCQHDRWGLPWSKFGRLCIRVAQSFGKLAPAYTAGSVVQCGVIRVLVSGHLTGQTLKAFISKFEHELLDGNQMLFTFYLPGDDHVTDLRDLRLMKHQLDLWPA